jgi:oxygen-independent coproporphyrinogen III oxidase
MENPGLYVHVPFCVSKCPYCGFYSIPSKTHVVLWLEAIQREAELHSGSFGEFDSLYLGGGTPSILDVREADQLVGHLFQTFSFTGGTEMTLEANPGDLTGEKLQGFRGIGFNRFNLGIQSFDDAVLSFLKRRHTARDAEEAFALLRSAGCENAGIDLMYGIGGQSEKKWMETLHRAVSLQPEHLSCYQLTIEPHTPFEKWQKKGLYEGPGEDTARSLFLQTSRFLKENGYIHYEVSNFAKTGGHKSRHNGKYWRHVPYLGLGPSAHSYRDRMRWWNVRSLKRYCEALSPGCGPSGGSETLTDEQMNLETVALGLRTMEGISLGDLPPTPGLDSRISHMEDSGWVSVQGGRLVPTPEGFLLADSLVRHLLF